MEKVIREPPPLLQSDFQIQTIKRDRTLSPHSNNPSQNSLNFSMKNLTSSPSNHRAMHHNHLNSSSSSTSSSERKSPHNNGSPSPSPTTKNVGVGANLLQQQRHSSAPVAVGHGHFGSINGPSSVSISAATNNRNGVSSPQSSSPTPLGESNQSPYSSVSCPSPSSGVNLSLKDGNKGLAGGGGVKGRMAMGRPPQTVPAAASSSPKGGDAPPTTTPAVASKIVSQNVNGTSLTTIPRTDSELQLFRVLQRANLLSYFDVMIELGGDDVQQLCEAGEEEFLEIMALIGMASKPLHVRRLQKALQEWMSNPALFQTPVLPPGVPLIGAPPVGAARSSASSGSSNSNLLTPSPPSSASTGLAPQLMPTTIPTTRTSPSLPSSQQHQQVPIRPIPYHHSSGNGGPSGSAAAAMAIAAAAVQQHAAAMFFDTGNKHKLHIATTTNNSNGHHGHHSSNSNSPNGSLNMRPAHMSPTSNASVSTLQMNHSFSNGYHHHPPRHHQNMDRQQEKEVRIPVDQIIPSHFLEQRIRTASEPNSPAASESPSESGSSHSPVPFLQENELTKVIDAAEQMVKTLPPYVFEPQVPSKRKFSGDFEKVMRLSPNDPQRVEEVRKMSTVYGRADPNCSTHPNKRKFPKPLTMHEVCVNEAAAQLAKHVPALLTYRDELCALAKQVVRDAGLSNYSSNQTHNYAIAVNNNNSMSYMNQNQIYTGGYSKKNSSSSSSSNLELAGYLMGGGSLNGISSSNDSSVASKRVRMDAANGIEIQEYSRPPSNQSDIVPSDNADAMQITPIKNLPRRSPSEEHSSPLPLELVTVTTSANSSPRRRSSQSVSPPRRLSHETDDLHNNSYNKASNNSGVKTMSIPVSGGSINISHNNSNDTIRGTLMLPIKMEPAN
ncbi:NGFI-A-binding protein homolog isoform X2 [Folsomia candida]|uniref:NGFI-A-binding protein homolog isoform X2 n=1 Tax=Folsomia candida TaxID=158441 RepID=UPI000B8F05E7|nr:NGFI-A-binding protein homolog isoform X2 [Folsomia candida]